MEGSIFNTFALSTFRGAVSKFYDIDFSSGFPKELSGVQAGGKVAQSIESNHQDRPSEAHWNTVFDNFRSFNYIREREGR